MTSLISIVVAEIRYRKLSSVCSAVIVATAVAAVIFFMLLTDLAADRTRTIQRDIGLNMRIIPADTDLERYWNKGYADGWIDENLLVKGIEQDVANRLVPMLQRTIPWGDGEAMLTGLGDELFSRGEKMKPVFGGIQQEAESLTIGAIAAGKRLLREGDSVKVLGRDFTIKRVLAATGSVDDIRVYASLPVVQDLLEMPGKLNEIRALECQCGADVDDPEAYIQAVLEPLFPGTRVIRQDSLAEARRKQRMMAERIGLVATPILITFASLAIFGLAFLNAQQRQQEIGLLAVLGKSAWTIGAIVWCRSALLGLLGGLLGGLAGWYLVNQFGDYFIGAGNAKLGFKLQSLLIGSALGGLIASSGAMLPAWYAARRDPAETLRGAG